MYRLGLKAWGLGLRVYRLGLDGVGFREYGWGLRVQGIQVRP